MPIFNINLLQQQQSRLSQLNQANLVAAVVAGTIVALQLLIVAFLYSTIAIRNSEKASIEKERAELQKKITELDKYENSFYPEIPLTQQAKAFQDQLSAAQGMVANHKYFSLYMSEVAINTPASVTYSTITSDATNRLVLTGKAAGYSEVSRLAESFKKLSFAKNATIQDAKLDSEKGSTSSQVRFTLNIDLKSAAELNKLPTPSNVGDQQARPQVSPGPSPRPSSSPSGKPVIPGGRP